MMMVVIVMMMMMVMVMVMVMQHSLRFFICTTANQRTHRYILCRSFCYMKTKDEAFDSQLHTSTTSHPISFMRSSKSHILSVESMASGNEVDGVGGFCFSLASIPI
jgi:hypothetical protein